MGPSPGAGRWGVGPKPTPPRLRQLVLPAFPAHPPVDLRDHFLGVRLPDPTSAVPTVTHLRQAAHDHALAIPSGEHSHHLIVAAPSPQDAVRAILLLPVHHVAARHEHLARDHDDAIDRCDIDVARRLGVDYRGASVDDSPAGGQGQREQGIGTSHRCYLREWGLPGRLTEPRLGHKRCPAWGAVGPGRRRPGGAMGGVPGFRYRLGFSHPWTTSPTRSSAMLSM